MLNKNGEIDSCVLGIADVDLVTLKVYPLVAIVETTCRVWCPCLASAWHYMFYNLAYEWCKGVCIVVMFPPEVCIC